MTQINLDEIIGKFRDGELTRREFGEIVRDIRKTKDYLSKEQVNGIGESCKRLSELTKHQYAQIVEYSLFVSTGVTRE